MKYLLAIVAIVLFPVMVFAQGAALPAVLQPDAFAESEAARLGAGVFKLLPRGTYGNPDGTYKDEENPIGVREGGSYYSFTNKTHSYNRVPQIELQKGQIQVGFYGSNYGLITDLGGVSLADVTDELPAALFLLNYQTPKYYRDVVSESRRAAKIEDGGRVFSDRRPAIVDHTYLLRAISFGEADKLVALQIIGTGKDGSLTVIWKSIKDFDVPRIVPQAEGSRGQE